jgi:hypothetical protein
MPACAATTIRDRHGQGRSRSTASSARCRRDASRRREARRRFAASASTSPTEPGWPSASRRSGWGRASRKPFRHFGKTVDAREGVSYLCRDFSLQLTHCFHGSDESPMTDFLAMHMEWVANPTAWVALLTLVVLEVVLGIDNLIFISILTNKLPEHQRASARRLGIGAALVMRLVLLATISFIVQLTQPVFDPVRPRLLVARPDPDRRRPVPGVEGYQGDPPHRRSRDHKDEMVGKVLQMSLRRGDFPDPAARPRLLDRFHHHRRRHDRRDRHHGTSPSSSR